jgi:thiamine transport system substrate-binding protein
VLAAVIITAMALLTSACGEEGRNDDLSSAVPEASDTSDVRGTTLRVVTHDSFNVSDAVIDAFEQETGITVELVAGGDAVQVVNQAVLTRDNPQADVLFGVDNNLLTRVWDANLFLPYESPELAAVDDDFELDPDHRVTPIDRGDVCLNFDREYFAARDLAVPATLQELTDPAYEDLLVVQNPSTSTPGLAFLLATVDELGEADWVDFWQRLKDNGVTVAEGWEQAYYERFSGGSGEGDRPLVVSYASSPPVEVTDLTTPVDQTPTGVIGASCYRQIEFAGILAGTEKEAAARLFIDFLLSLEFQNDMPANMYVYPVRDDATLPEAFAKYSLTIDDPLEIPPEQVGVNRDTWVEQWTAVFGS